MTVELVLLTPVLVAFLVFIAFLARLVSVQGDVEAAAREAARQASLQRTESAALAAAADAVVKTVPAALACTPAVATGGFTPGGTVLVEVTCDVPLDDLGLVGVSGTVPLDASSRAPLDVYRRTG